jgi:hypothetical protein
MTNYLDCLFGFAASCEYLMNDQDWGDWGMEEPSYVVYTDGGSTEVKLEDMFLSSHYVPALTYRNFVDVHIYGTPYEFPRAREKLK